jgi:hypothetical protein
MGLRKYLQFPIAVRQFCAVSLSKLYLQEALLALCSSMRSGSLEVQAMLFIRVAAGDDHCAAGCAGLPQRRGARAKPASTYPQYLSPELVRLEADNTFVALASSIK